MNYSKCLLIVFSVFFFGITFAPTVSAFQIQGTQTTTWSWLNGTNFPSGCPVGYAVNTIALIPICVATGFTDHNSLNNLAWSVAGHTIDQNFSLSGNWLTNYGNPFALIGDNISSFINDVGYITASALTPYITIAQADNNYPSKTLDCPDGEALNNLTGTCIPTGGTDTNEFTAGRVNANGVRIVDFNMGGHNVSDVNKITWIYGEANGWLDFVAQTINPPAVTAGEVRLHSATTQGFTRLEADNEGATNPVIPRDSITVARNTSGASIAKGKVVRVTGSTGNVPNIALADNNSLTYLPAVFVVLDTIGNGNFGQVMRSGIIINFDTSAFSAGQPVWVGSNGSLTNVRPTTPKLVQRVGTILVSGVGNGSLDVLIAPAILGMETGTINDFNGGGNSLYNWKDVNANRFCVGASCTTGFSNYLTSYVTPVDDFTIKRNAQNGELKVADRVENNILENSFRLATLEGQSAFLLDDAFTDTFSDQNYVNTGTSKGQTYDAAGKYYYNGGTSAGWDVNDRIVGQWKMNDNAASTAVLRNVGSYDGTASANTSALTTAGKINTALFLTRASSQYITLPYQAIQPGAGDFTITLWGKSTAGSGAYGGWLSNRGGSPQLAINIQGTKTEFYVGSTYYMGDNVIQDGAWHFFVMKRTSGVMYLAIDQVTQATSGATNTANLNSTTDYKIGCYYADCSGGHYLEGGIDDLRFFNAALTAAELTALYNGGNGTEESTVAGAATIPNISLISNTITADASPRNMRGVIYEEDVNTQAPMRVNQDINLYTSRDNNKTWTQITLVDDGNYGTGQRILTGINSLTTQDANANIKWKIVTDNNRALKIHGISLAWDSNNDPNNIYTPAPQLTTEQTLQAIRNISTKNKGQDLNDASFPEFTKTYLTNYDSKTSKGLLTEITRGTKSTDFAINNKNLNLFNLWGLKALDAQEQNDYAKCEADLTKLKDSLVECSTAKTYVDFQKCLGAIK